MPDVAHLLRRLPRAALVAVATALVFGGVLGTVQAAGGDDADEGSLLLPRPAIGDRWTYQALLEGAWKSSADDPALIGTPFPFAELQWLDPVLVRDADGLEAAADLLHIRSLRYSDSDDLAEMRDGRYWVPDEDRYLHRLGNVSLLAHEFRVKSQQVGNTGANGIGAAGVTALQTGSTAVVEGWSRSLMADDAGADAYVEAGCLSRLPAQGRPVPLDQPIGAALWDCLPAFPDGWPGDGMFSFAERESVAGFATYRFDNGRDGSIWLSPASPVPVQMKAWDGANVATVTLSSFEPGDAPLGTLSPQVGSSAAPALRLAPRQPWGADDSGVDHPWPASRAYQDALSDPSWADLREWTAAHPRGTTFWVEYAEDLEGTPQTRSWLFGLGDGDATFGFIAVRSSADASPLPLPAPVRYQDLGFMSFFLDALAPDPDLLPTDVPTVASALDRWASYEALEGRPAVANGWGFGLYCVLDCGYGVFGDLVAGRDPVAILNIEGFTGSDSLAPSGVFERTFTGSQLTVHADGRTLGLVNWTGYDSGLSVPGLDGQNPVDPSAEPVANEPRLVAASFVPTPGQGAAIGLASLLAGLVYWLWPSLKTGSLLGLFSRVEGPRLLAHPTRARLMELIQAEPGVHFQDLARKAGLANGTAVHHLRKLDAAGLVAARPLGRYTCYFPGASPTATALEQAPVLRSPGARLVFGTIQDRPGLSGLEIASRVGLGASTVNYHVQRLVEVGLVSSVREGRLVRLRATTSAA
jgi:DNA-binding transcriptional ArsR family regulator